MHYDAEAIERDREIEREIGRKRREKRGREGGGEGGGEKERGMSITPMARLHPSKAIPTESSVRQVP